MMNSNGGGLDDVVYDTQPNEQKRSRKFVREEKDRAIVIAVIRA